MRPTGALWMALLVTASACAPSAVPAAVTASPAAVATQSAAPTATAQPQGICGTVPTGTTARVLFFSDLTEKCPAIGNLDDADRAATHGATGYLVRLKGGPGIEFAAGPDRAQYVSAAPADVRVEFDTDTATGQSQVGISCRRVEGVRTFTEYHLVLGTDGTYTIEAGPPYRTLASGKTADAMRAGSNHIRADCVGTTLTLYANGQRIATAEDDQLTGRLNGLFFRSLDGTGATMTFRNLLITAP